ncbi:MAG: YdgA family protein [Desulfobulbaceae bacterium]|nr:YdgA family protein [Desulfobulbaceae bacterium]
MKKIVIVVFILVIVGLTIPLINGIITEKNVHKTFEDLNVLKAGSGSDITLAITDYQRGYRSSVIEWKLNFGKMGALYGIDEILFVDRAEHGLTGITTHTSLERNTWFKEFIDKRLGGVNPLDITTTFALDGTIESTLSMDAFSIQEGEKVIHNKPGKITVSCENDCKQVASTANWDGLVSDALLIEGLNIDSSLKMVSAYIWEGRVNFSANRLIGNDLSGKFELTGLKGGQYMTYYPETKKVSIGMEYGFGSLQAEKANANNGFVRLMVNNLDAEGYEEFLKLYTETMVKVAENISVAQQSDSEQLNATMQTQMNQNGFMIFAAFEKLLKKNLEIQISDLTVHLPEGEVKGDLVLSLKQDISMMQLFPLISQPALVTELFHFHSSATMPKELGNESPMLLAPLNQYMPTGLFVENGEKLVHSVEIRDNKLFLNEQEVLFN